MTPDVAPLPNAFVVLNPDGRVLAFGRTRREAWLELFASEQDACGDNVSSLEARDYRCVECRLTPVESAP